MIRKRGIWYYIQNYRFQSIFVRNFIIVLALVILPLAAMSSFLYRSSNQVVESEISQVNINSINRVRDILDVLFRETNMLATQISQQTETQLFMLDNNTTDIAQGRYNKINQTINMFTLIYEYISSIYVYAEKNRYIISNIENEMVERFADQTWYPFYEQSNSVYSKAKPRKSREVYPFLLSFIKPSYLNAQDKIGAVVINIDLEELGKLIQPKDGQEAHDIFILDEQNNLIYRSDMKLLFQNRIEPEILSYANKVNASDIVSIEGRPYMLTAAKLSFNDWTCISLLPMQTYEKKIRSILNYTIWLMLLFAAIGVIIAFLISVRTFQPIRSIIDVMDRLNRQEQEHPPDRRGKRNELNYISGNLIQSEASRKLIEDDLALRTKLLNEAQAAALQAQINPHFIGNSLETINWMAIELTNEPSNEVSRTIGTLSQLIQLSLNMNERLVPIRVEVEHANLYLRMMDIRYKDRFHVVWDIPEEMLPLIIVKLSIQPILENAILHGIQPSRRQGIITIAGTVEADEMTLTISDNGVGMNGELVDRLNTSMQQENIQEVEHIGLKNVNQRIRLNFGEAFGLTVESGMGQGTTVIMKLPIVHEVPKQ